MSKSILDRWYRLAPNGKQEFMGVDGANHGVYTAMALVVVMIAVAIYTFSIHGGYMWIIYSQLIATPIVFVIFYLIEVFQEKSMLRRFPNRFKAGHRYWNSKDWDANARYCDIKYPMIACGLAIPTSVSLAFIVFILGDLFS